MRMSRATAEEFLRIYDAGIKFGVAMTEKDQRIQRLEKTVMTMAIWISQSSAGVLRADEVHELEKILKGKAI